MKSTTLRATVLIVLSSLVMFVWAFPVLWTLLTSFKTDLDVLAYPPVVFFEPQWRNYVQVLFGAIPILPALWDSAPDLPQQRGVLPVIAFSNRTAAHPKISCNREQLGHFHGPYESGRSVAWLARLFRVQEVVSSNLTAPTSFYPEVPCPPHLQCPPPNPRWFSASKAGIAIMRCTIH